MTGDPGSAGDLPADPPPFPVPPLVRAWRGFREWRHTRPFWGGLFLVLSGLEFYLSGHLDVLPVKLSFGGQSFLAWLIPIALVLCGVLVWYTPAQRAFYGILGAAISVAALIGLNLGGFFVGMIFGIVGGALSFSWTPVADEPAAVPDEPSPPDEFDEPLPPDERSEGPSGGRYGATLLLFIVAVTAAALLLPAPSPAAAAPCPSPSVSPSAPASSGAPGVNPVAGFFQQLGRLLGIGGSADPAPSAAPSSSPSRPAPCGTPVPSPPRPAPSTPSKGKRDVQVESIVVNEVPSQQITARLSQSGLSFDGVVDLRTHTGTIRVLKFSLSSSSSVPFELRVPAPGGTLSLRSSDLTVSGSVSFYTTEIKGRLFGLLPVTYTPDSPPLLTVPDVVFTDATVQLVYVHAGLLTAPTFRVGYL